MIVYLDLQVWIARLGEGGKKKTEKKKNPKRLPTTIMPHKTATISMQGLVWIFFVCLFYSISDHKKNNIRSFHRWTKQYFNALIKKSTCKTLVFSHSPALGFFFLFELFRALGNSGQITLHDAQKNKHAANQRCVYSPPGVNPDSMYFFLITKKKR